MPEVLPIPEQGRQGMASLGELDYDVEEALFQSGDSDVDDLFENSVP